MTEPQVWTLIGVFAAALIGMVTFTTQVMWRAITSQFVSFRAEMRAEFATSRAETSAQISELRAETSAQISELRTETSAQISELRLQISDLDGDVQAIARRVFPE